MNKYLLTSVLCLAGCGSDDHYSPLMIEDGEVYDVAFVPAGHGSDIAVGFNMGGQGGSTITPIDVVIPERYAIVFKCQHGKFVIAGDKAKSLYHKLDRGDKVTISYREVRRTVNGKTAVVDLDFLDAVKMLPAEKPPGTNP